jgi:hypothetical protein
MLLVDTSCRVPTELNCRCVEEYCLLGIAPSKEDVKALLGHPHIIEACSDYVAALSKTNGNIDCIPASNSALACIDLKHYPSSGKCILNTAPRSFRV